MCGIAGVFDSDSENLGDDLARLIGDMCDVIEHRGPDDYGFFITRGVAMGMRRLSIIDLAGGRQPLASEDGSVRVVFNGEIYNYKDLRGELLSRGHRFATDSDTEVIVHLYEEHGERCVERLRGMFAFAVYDGNRRCVMLARDRLGIKPLHYAVLNGTLVFGSEIKSILRHPDAVRRPNLAAISDFLAFGYIPDPASAFAGIHKLPPANTLTFKDGRATLRQYWRLDGRLKPRDIDEREHADRLIYQLRESVSSHLVSDVPIGAFLSGGIDSSAVVALMSQSTDRPVKTFSIGFGEQSFDELRYARMSARQFGTDHHEFIVTPDVCRIVEEVAWHHDEPFADYSSIPTYLVSKLAGEHVKVVLSGDGSDELFGGYDRYPVETRRSGFDVIPRVIGKWMGGVARKLPRGAYGRRFLNNISLRGPERYIDSISYFNRTDRRELFGPDLLAELRFQEPEQRFLSIYYAGRGTHLDRLLYLDARTYLPGDILTKVDRMSMANSIEARVPFLDHMLVELAHAIPAPLKFSGSRTKYILKQALRGLLPDELIYRSKQGFDVPMGRWMNGELRAMLHDLFADRRTRQRGYFNWRAVDDLVSEHQRGRRDHSRRLWQLVTLELWHRMFVDQKPEPKFPGIKQVPMPVRGLACYAGGAA